MFLALSLFTSRQSAQVFPILQRFGNSFKERPKRERKSIVNTADSCDSFKIASLDLEKHIFSNLIISNEMSLFSTSDHAAHGLSLLFARYQSKYVYVSNKVTKIHSFMLMFSICIFDENI